MKKFISQLFATVILFSISFSLFAAPTGLDGIVITQKQNGTEIQVRVFGDEYYREFYYEQTPGKKGPRIVKAKDGVWYYATLSSDKSEIIPSNKVVNKDSAPAESYGELKIEKNNSSTKASRSVKTFTRQNNPLEKRAILNKIQRLIDIDADPKDIENAKESFRTYFNEEPITLPKIQNDNPTSALMTSGDINQTPIRVVIPPKVIGLCVLVSFADEEGKVPVSEFQGFFNGDDYTGHDNIYSVKGYFKKQSDGKLELTQEIPTQYVKLDKTKNYYDTQAAGVFANDVAIAVKAQVTNIDFKKLTQNNGAVTSFSIFYAGSEGADALWPHSWSLKTPVEIAPGVKVAPYQISAIGSGDLKIGTFCHESSHMVLQVMDYYDYGDPNRYNCGDAFQSAGVGNHCLMGAGNYQGGGKNPAQFSSYLKYILGWNKTEDLSISAQYRLTADEYRSFRIPKPNSKTEYFLIENRYGTDKDPSKKHLPAHGWAIWHVDEAVTTFNELQQRTKEKHFELSLAQADGRFDLESNANRGDGTDYYTETSAPFNAKTNPGTIWWDGVKSSISIRFIDQNNIFVNFYDGFEIELSPLVEYFTDTMQVTVSCLNQEALLRYTSSPNGFEEPTMSSKQIKSGDKLTLSSTTFLQISSFTTDGKVQTSIKNAYKKRYPLLVGLSADSDFPTNIRHTEDSWFGQDIGGLSARSGIMRESGKISYFEVTFPKDCSVTFDWRVEGFPSDNLKFSIYKANEEKEQIAYISPTIPSTGWTSISKYIRAGTTVRWQYILTGSVTDKMIQEGREFQGYIRNIKLRYPTIPQVVTISDPTTQNFTLTKGLTKQIIAFNSVPSNGVQYRSLSPDIVSVSPTGLMTAIKAGLATVQAYHPGDAEYIPADEKSLFVNVPKDEQFITVKNKSIYMNNNSTCAVSKLEISITPADRKNLITFKISDPRIILVEGGLEKGNIISYRPGKVLLTVEQTGDDKFAPAKPIEIEVIVSPNNGNTVSFNTPSKEAFIAQNESLSVHNLYTTPISGVVKLSAPKIIDAKLNLQSSLSANQAQKIDENEYRVLIKNSDAIGFEIITNSEANLSRVYPVSANLINIKDINSGKKAPISQPKIKIAYTDNRLILREPIVHHIYVAPDSRITDSQYLNVGKNFVDREAIKANFTLAVPPTVTDHFAVHGSAIDNEAALLIFPNPITIDQGSLDSFTAYAVPKNSKEYSSMQARSYVYIGHPIAPGASAVIKTNVAKPVAEYFKPFETIKLNKIAKKYKAPIKIKNGIVEFGKTNKMYRPRKSTEKTQFTADLIASGSFQAKAIGINIVEYFKIGNREQVKQIMTKNMLPPQIDSSYIILTPEGKSFVVVNTQYMGKKPIAKIETLKNAKVKSQKLSEMKKPITGINSEGKLVTIIPIPSIVGEGVYIYNINKNINPTLTRTDIVLDNGVGLGAKTL